MLSSRAIRRAFARAPALSRGYASGHTQTPYRFRFLLHTEEFADMLEQKTAGEAIPNHVLDQLAAFRASHAPGSAAAEPSLKQDLVKDFHMQGHDIAEMKYDLAEYYHFHVPSTDRTELKTGEDVANWVKYHVQRTKAAESEDWVPRNMSGGY